MASFLQWNIRGLRANREDLSVLLADTDPTAVCLQETFLTSDKTMKFNNYKTYCIPAYLSPSWWSCPSDQKWNSSQSDFT